MRGHGEEAPEEEEGEVSESEEGGRGPPKNALFSRPFSLSSSPLSLFILPLSPLPVGYWE